MLENITEVKKITSSMIRYLKEEQDYDLAEILKGAYPSSEVINYDNWNGGTYTYAFTFEVEIGVYRKHRALIDTFEKKLIDTAELFINSENEQLGAIRIRPICRQYIDWSQGITKEQIVNMIDQIKSKMVAVATGGPQIQDVNDDYKKLYTNLDSWLVQLGIDNPNIFRDLWDWYGRWRQGDLEHYADRRAFIQKLYQDVLDIISNSNNEQIADEFTPTGWDRVDRTVYEMKRRLAVANTEEQFQAIGMLGREALITIAQQVFNKEIHKTEDGITPSETDAKRMLDAFLSSVLKGAENERQRKFAKSSVDLANQLTHDRMAVRGDAQICLTAVSAVASIVRIIAEK